jgi:hypothetical protein
MNLKDDKQQNIQSNWTSQPQQGVKPQGRAGRGLNRLGRGVKPRSRLAFSLVVRTMLDVTVANRRVRIRTHARAGTVAWQGSAGNRRRYADPFQNSPGFVDSSYPS